MATTIKDALQSKNGDEVQVEGPVANGEQVRAAMASVFHGTQWTAVYDQTALTAAFYCRGRYDHPLSLGIDPQAIDSVK